MRIGVVSSAAPLVWEGHRSIAVSVAAKLVEAGHEVETIWLPQTGGPRSILQQMLAFRLINLNDSCDRIIALCPPAHVVPHHTKIVWFVHHKRAFYDLWDTRYRIVPDTAYWRSFRRTLISADTTALNEAHAVFTISATVKRRLRKFNNIEAGILYPPVAFPSATVTRAGETPSCQCRRSSTTSASMLCLKP